jgi:hypothetical protein
MCFPESFWKYWHFTFECHKLLSSREDENSDLIASEMNSLNQKRDDDVHHPIHVELVRSLKEIAARSIISAANTLCQIDVSCDTRPIGWRIESIAIRLATLTKLNDGDRKVMKMNADHDVVQSGNHGNENDFRPDRYVPVR